MWEKIKELTSIVKYELSTNPVLMVGILGGSITRLIGILFSTYLIIWIQSFDRDINDRISKEDGKTIYSNIMVIAVLISAFVFPFVGRICDTYKPKYTVPFSFFFRAISTYIFLNVENPRHWNSYFSCILMIIATIIENISVDTLFAKNLPKETRAILNGVYSFSGNSGILLYSLLSGWLVDNVGPKSPFALIGLLDILFGLSVFCFSDQIFFKDEE